MKYTVEIIRVEYYSATIEVEASNKKQAEEEANEQADSDDFNLQNAEQWVDHIELSWIEE